MLGKEESQAGQLQGLLIINALLYILAIPSVFSNIYVLVVGTMAFLLTCFISFKLIRQGEWKLALFIGSIAFIYNPVFLFIFNLKEWSLLDISISTIFFILSAGLYRYSKDTLLNVILLALGIIFSVLLFLFYIYIFPQNFRKLENNKYIPMRENQK